MKHTTKKMELQIMRESNIRFDQFIYMEREYHYEANAMIEDNIAYLENLFLSNGCEFVYLPKLAKRITGQEYLDYMVPTGERTEQFQTADVFKLLFNENDNMPTTPFIMRYVDFGSNSLIGIWEFENNDGESIKKELIHLIPQIRPGRECRASISVTSNEKKKKKYKKNDKQLFGSLFKNFTCNTSDSQYDWDQPNEYDNSFDCECIEEDVALKHTQSALPIKVQWETNVKDIDADTLFNDIMASDQYIEATNKIYEGIKELHKLGIGSLIIRSIAGSRNLLSRIRIDDSYRITLPDYNNMEIEMAPITKALYLLFLRHEEGIVFKELPDYRSELTALYWDMIDSDNEKDVTTKIERITDPFNNDINVHCSRIKAAFTLKFENMLAINYYIHGKRGEAKRISLPRNLVEWTDIAV